MPRLPWPEWVSPVSYTHLDVYKRQAIKGPEITHVEGSTIRLHGRVRGQISGFIDADVRGVFQGSLHAMVESGTIEVDETRPELPPSEELAGDGDESETGEEKGDDI